MCKPSNWLVFPQCNPNAQLRIFCFPYAGGNVTTYTPWLDFLPKQVELVFVQPPGRGSRLLEPGYNSVTELVNDLLPEIKKYLEEKPYLLFGHSMGARMSYELVKKIITVGIPLPVHFVASGSPAPDHKMKESPMHLSDDAEFIDRLRNLNGTPEEILENSELMALLLPALRKDFELAETYKCAPTDPIDCPITVFRGMDDEWVEEQAAEKWFQFFGSNTHMETFSGGHMFIEQSQHEVVKTLVSIIEASD